MFYGGRPPVCFTSYVNGSSGTFLTGMIEKMCCPMRKKPIRITYNNPWNNAHGTINTNTSSSEDIGYFGSSKDYFKRLIVNNDFDPIFHPTHFYDPYAVLERWPNAKIFLVTHTLEDAPEIAINSLFKFALHDVKGFDDQNFQDRISRFFTEKDNILTAAHYNFKHYGPAEVKTVLEFRKTNLLGAGYWRINVPDDLKEHVFEIPYKKIIYDQKWTLDTLTKVLGFPTNNFVENEYANYINEQKKLFDKIDNFLNKGQT
jgi:hypothetical protein